MIPSMLSLTQKTVSLTCPPSTAPGSYFLPNHTNLSVSSLLTNSETSWRPLGSSQNKAKVHSGFKPQLISSWGQLTDHSHVTASWAGGGARMWRRIKSLGQWPKKHKTYYLPQMESDRRAQRRERKEQTQNALKVTHSESSLSWATSRASGSGDARERKS